ncbi:hypothetical transcript [Echinococcus multilocularis]|uniref:Hypothetical transcript n=1 Tax=Echinococcus multilocularis TaxID=6211 RepID=A0A068XZC0_ECHMU|nr:hypothetical transcript [Echinococcus multilocularis]
MLLDQQLRDLSRLLQIFHPLLAPANSNSSSASPQWSANCASADLNRKEGDNIKECSLMISDEDGAGWGLEDPSSVEEEEVRRLVETVDVLYAH